MSYEEFDLDAIMAEFEAETAGKGSPNPASGSPLPQPQPAPAPARTENSLPEEEPYEEPEEADEKPARGFSGLLRRMAKSEAPEEDDYGDEDR